ncbi:hypothetical protein ADK64_35670 [Streptomyces sp. MMG1121]|nr:hypothetical protein ADK64_35670 [Streptomyces sp. MMG1121]
MPTPRPGPPYTTPPLSTKPEQPQARHQSSPPPAPRKHPIPYQKTLNTPAQETPTTPTTNPRITPAHLADQGLHLGWQPGRAGPRTTRCLSQPLEAARSVLRLPRVDRLP